jgi:hypothetical protein
MFSSSVISFSLSTQLNIVGCKRILSDTIPGFLNLAQSYSFLEPVARRQSGLQRATNIVLTTVLGSPGPFLSRVTNSSRRHGVLVFLLHNHQQVYSAKPAQCLPLGLLYWPAIPFRSWLRCTTAIGSAEGPLVVRPVNRAINRPQRR